LDASRRAYGRSPTQGSRARGASAARSGRSPRNILPHQITGLRGTGAEYMYLLLHRRLWHAQDRSTSDRNLVLLSRAGRGSVRLASLTNVYRLLNDSKVNAAPVSTSPRRCIAWLTLSPRCQ